MFLLPSSEIITFSSVMNIIAYHVNFNIILTLFPRLFPCLLSRLLMYFGQPILLYKDQTAQLGAI